MGIVSPAPIHAASPEVKDAREDLKTTVAMASAKVRTDFASRGFEYLGMTTVSGRTSAFIRKTGWVALRNYRQGDIVEGYTLVSIAPDHVIFESQNIQLMLGVSEAQGQKKAVATAGGSRVQEAAGRVFDETVELDEETELADVHGLEDTELLALTAPFKEAEAALKSKTRTFDQAAVLRVHGFLPDDLVRNTLDGTGKNRFIMPMKGKITSRFGYRKRPTGGARRYHRGVDIAASYGTSIRAAASGKVSKVSRSWAKGLYVEIKHADGYSTAYFHLHKAAVQPGWSVAQGEIIGYEGNSGQSTGPHLHFEILKNGEQVNPALYLDELGG